MTLSIPAHDLEAGEWFWRGGRSKIVEIGDRAIQGEEHNAGG
jgi:hypothetical protein